MTNERLDNIRIGEPVRLWTPKDLKKELPVTDELSERIIGYRKTIEGILSGEDKRKLFIVGPCSVHDYNGFLEYSESFRDWSEKYKDKFFLAIRAHVEKPRTLADWPGFIWDPYLDKTYNANDGFYHARELFIKLNEMGIPVNCEFVDPRTPARLADLVTVATIGARTVESQPHKQMASGLSMPVGFKNSTSGVLSSMVNAIKSAALPQYFTGPDEFGVDSHIPTYGNPFCFGILRGGGEKPNYKPNYDSKNVAIAQTELSKSGLRQGIVIDCSHANSEKNYEKQEQVLKDVVYQMKTNRDILGVMIESYIKAGNHKNLPDNFSGLGDLEYGLSFTDSCLSRPRTGVLLTECYRDIEIN